MKKILFLAALGFTVLLTIISSCKKDNSSSQAMSYTDEINLMADQAGTAMDNQEVYSDDQSQTITMLNDGIAPDFLVDESYMDDATTAKDPGKVFIRDHSFIHCLKGLALSDSQFVQVKHGLHAYKSCTDHAVQRIRTIYQNLKEKYHDMYVRLWNAYQKGALTYEEFKKKVAGLRNEFKQEVRKLHLQEKLHESLKHCLSAFFKDLHGILTDRQWNAFIKCYKQ